MDQDTVIREIGDDLRELLDSQLANLSARIFEVGKRADQQLTAWLTFAALTLLLALGAADSVAIGSVNLSTTVATGVAYGLSCVFYYRATLSMAALGVWRSSLRQLRLERFTRLLALRDQNTGTKLPEVRRRLHGWIPEYPGYLACIVLIKQEAKERGGPASAAYIRFIHSGAILGFGLAPYGLAAAFLVRADWSPAAVAVAVVGLAFTLSANVIIRLKETSSNESSDQGATISSA